MLTDHVFFATRKAEDKEFVILGNKAIMLLHYY